MIQKPRSARKIDELCEHLEWDSEFFKVRIARARTHSLTPEDVERIFQWCALNGIECLYFLADSEDEQTIQLAEANGFHLVDIRVTMEQEINAVQSIPKSDTSHTARLSVPEDVPVLREIARVSHHTSRFYSDSNFSSERCDALYETWIEKSCRGYADAVLVAEHDSRPVGYVTCHLLDRDKGQIGLIAVSSGSQGRGVGRELATAALNWFSANGVNRVTVVTQGRNTRAQRLNQRCGFFTTTVQLWYHRWFGVRPDGRRR